MSRREGSYWASREFRFIGDWYSPLAAGKWSPHSTPVDKEQNESRSSSLTPVPVGLSVHTCVLTQVFTHTLTLGLFRCVATSESNVQVEFHDLIRVRVR